MCYHYSHSQDNEMKELHYRIKSAEKALPLGYYDDIYQYLEGALKLAESLDVLTTIRTTLEMAIVNIESSGLRSARGHRRPSLTSVDMPDANGTPLATPRTRELPNKLRELESNVIQKFSFVLERQQNNAE